MKFRSLLRVVVVSAALSALFADAAHARPMNQITNVRGTDGLVGNVECGVPKATAYGLVCDGQQWVGSKARQGTYSFAAGRFYASSGLGLGYGYLLANTYHTAPLGKQPSSDGFSATTTCHGWATSFYANGYGWGCKAYQTAYYGGPIKRWGTMNLNAGTFFPSTAWS